MDPIRWPQDAPATFGGKAYWTLEVTTHRVPSTTKPWLVIASGPGAGVTLAEFDSEDGAEAFAGRLREFLGVRPLDPDEAAERELEGLQDPRYI